ncbi:family 10 glycosylhydrolase [uncultured Brachyspira sp.]|uniref:glycoside hydrolase family 10 protein n=1 Tax=uncultured Brachyspira sp. TaxID=221953 RepID=UPI00262F4923|nr:family 10 glycosylhydrolase [uncultured Brachyspira sp.]
MKKIIIIISLAILLISSCNTLNIIVPNNIRKILAKNINEDRSKNPLYREFRAAWISSVVNIDWPLKGGSESEQKKLILKYLNTLYENNFNALFIQVKPDAGVIFKSKINPATRYFSGSYTTNERDDYPFKTDMLEFIIEEAHNRNLEVHAWFNPYRISLNYDKNKSYEEQFSKKNFIHTYISNNLKPIYWYDNRLYLDPGEPISAKYIKDSVMEVVENYDIDGIHFDDYFYQNAAKGKTYKDWPDKISAEKYGEKRGYDINNKDYDDYGVNGLYAWRRDNINRLVSDIYKEIKSRKPYVKWTISPAGVWRNKEKISEYAGSKYGSRTKSYNPNFDALHADVLLWMLNGEKTSSLNNASVKDGLNKMYIDAVIPQVYWSSKHRTAPFNTIVKWWVNEAEKSSSGKLADIYIGHALYRMGSSSNIEPWQDIDLMSRQINYIRDVGKGYIKGSSFFTMHNMYKNDRDTGNFGNDAVKYIKENNYIFKAIVPTMNTMKNINKAPLKLENPSIRKVFGGIKLTFTDPNEYKLDKYGHLLPSYSAYYAVYRETIGETGIELIDKIRRKNFNVNSKVTYKDKTIDSKKTYIYYITALDRIHNESEYLKIVNN